jgi:uncharacterized BrkB/YihY/UPF0761 family membrane protein
MRTLLYFLPSLLIILLYIAVYIFNYNAAKNKGERVPNVLEKRYIDAFIVCLIFVIVNFGVVYFFLGHREKPQHYVLPHIDEHGKLIKTKYGFVLYLLDLGIRLNTE